MFPFRLRVLAALAFSVSGAVICSAQTEVGGATLNGTVSDPTGAVISGAHVRITSAQTGLARETVTTDAGLYAFVRVPVGVYSISADHPGFKAFRQDNVRL